MRHLRLPILSLLIATLLLLSMPVAALGAERDPTPETIGSVSELVPRLLDGLAWALPLAWSAGDTAIGLAPPPSAGPTDSPARSTPTSGSSSNTESGALIDPNG